MKKLNNFIDGKSIVLIVLIIGIVVCCFVADFVEKSWSRLCSAHPAPVVAVCFVSSGFVFAVIPKFFGGFDEPFFPNWLACVISIAVVFLFLITLVSLIFNKRWSYEGFAR
ncbi:MAG TPA: hypothetical protein PKZ36_00620 [Candidatus Paceibacterota bacterium]|nr:hypothetical protein [Candidatus Paceibacterota bacterium]HPT17903.1 hypothetical protein [Candidatus Paceibacterota bacterium]